MVSLQFVIFLYRTIGDLSKQSIQEIFLESLNSAATGMNPVPT
jgi:hypothetical protein